MDIAIPNGNEDEFLEMAKRLGTLELRFLYDSFSLAIEKKHEHPTWHIGILSSNPNEIRKAKQKGIFSATATNEVAVIESAPDLIIEPEKTAPKDGLHARNSGLNQVLCALLAKKGIALGISFSMILAASGKERAMLLGRAKQNIHLAKKYDVQVFLLSCARSPYALRGSIDSSDILSLLHP